MKKKPISRRSILNDLLVLIVVVIVALAVLLKDRNPDIGEKPLSTESVSQVDPDSASKSE